MRVSGEIFWISLPTATVGVAYNSGSGEISVRVGPVYVPRWGWPPWTKKYYSFVVGKLKLETLPQVVLGQVSDGVLTLYVGPEAGARNLHGDEPDEDVLIERLSAGSDEGEKVRITMFVHSETYDNVLKILIPDMGAGEDSVEICDGVSIPVEVHFGDDEDTLISAGLGIVIAYGDGDADTLEGGSGNDQLFGGPGNDFIDGKAGQDWIEGGDDDDFLIGGANADILKGGGGSDWIAGDLAGVTFDETGYVLQTTGSASGGNDRIEGGDGADVIFGGSGTDEINGDAGEDVLIGDDGTATFSQEQGVTFTLTDLDYSGNDIIYGGADSDRLFGQKGEDILLGGEGDDELLGGGGDDILIGGSGIDRLVGNDGDDILVGEATDYDGDCTTGVLPDLEALRAIQDEWVSGHSYDRRVANIGNHNPAVDRLNGTYFLIQGTTVRDTGEQDQLNGSPGQNWLIPAPKPLDVGNLVKITQGSMVFDRRTGQYSVEIRITNTSQATIQGPVHLVVDTISDPGVTLANSDGQTSDRRPYLDLSDDLGDGKLSPGEVLKIRLYFNNPLRKRFTFDLPLFGVI